MICSSNHILAKVERVRCFHSDPPFKHHQDSEEKLLDLFDHDIDVTYPILKKSVNGINDTFLAVHLLSPWHWAVCGRRVEAERPIPLMKGDALVHINIVDTILLSRQLRLAAFYSS